MPDGSQPALPAGRRGLSFGPIRERSPIWPSGRSWLDGHAAVAAIGILLAVRLVLIGQAALIPEEAYYWMYSMHPAVGYLDHPPMVAWLISAGTALLGPTEAGVRLATWLLAVGSTLLAYRLGVEWFGRRVGLTTALLFSTAPVLCGTGFVATPDAPLIFFWLLALVALTRACRTGQRLWWLVTGVAVGLAFMSKYPAAMLLPGALLFLLSDSRGRAALRTPWPWVAVGAALLTASPVIWWNYTHDWASFAFQFARRAGQHGHLAPLKTLGWVGAQIGVLSPLVFFVVLAALWAALRRVRRDARGRWRFGLALALPWLAVCAYHGLFSNIKINWPIPGYLSLLPLAAVILHRPGLTLTKAVSWRLHWVVIRRYVPAMAVINSIILLYIAIPVPGAPRPELMAPWPRLGSLAEAAEDGYQYRSGVEPFILVDGKYKLASELAFYMRDSLYVLDDWNEIVPIETVIGGGLNYQQWLRPERFVGRDAIFVVTEPTSKKLSVLASCFEHVGRPRLLFSHAIGWASRQEYWVIPCRRFLGKPTPASILGARE